VNQAPPVPGDTYSGILRVLVAHAAPGCETFADLLQRVPGAYPGAVQATLDQLAARCLIDTETRQRLAHTAAGGTDDEPGSAVLPAPHPLDYDWRWTSSTVRELTARCVSLTRPGDTIVLLGTPTLFAATAASPRDRAWILLEASPATTSALLAISAGNVIRCDLACDPLPPIRASAAVADPPWYPDSSRTFLWASAQLTAPGSTVLLAQPALATRPGVLDERDSILQFAGQTGLDIARIGPAALTYLTPQFERSAITALGLDAIVPPTWRRGDLLELRRTARPAGPRPPAGISETWTEVVLGQARIRFRLDQPPAAQSDPRLLPLIDGDILPTVSRRHPVRGQVRVWTGANRIFGCGTPGLLAGIAAALASGRPPADCLARDLGRSPTADERYATASAARQLRALACEETAAATAHGRDLATVVTAADTPIRVDRAHAPAGGNP
jgi:hypothetical protein